MNYINWLFGQPWFWPQDEREDPSFITRLGRMFHWIWIAISGVLFAAAAFDAAWWVWNHVKGIDDGGMASSVGLTCLGFSVVTWMFGRGVRYVFSGE